MAKIDVVVFRLPHQILSGLIPALHTFGLLWGGASSSSIIQQLPWPLHVQTCTASTIPKSPNYPPQLPFPGLPIPPIFVGLMEFHSTDPRQELVPSLRSFKAKSPKTALKEPPLHLHLQLSQNKKQVK